MNCSGGSGPRRAWRRHDRHRDDPASAAFPAEAAGFAPLPLRRLPFSTILVASSNDPYATPQLSTQCAAAWGSRLVEAGPLGHINAASGLGEWRQGFLKTDKHGWPVTITIKYGDTSPISCLVATEDNK